MARSEGSLCPFADTLRRQVLTEGATLAMPRLRLSLDRQHARPQLRNVRLLDARACREQ